MNDGYQGGGWKHTDKAEVIRREACHWNCGVVCNEYGSTKCRLKCSFNPANAKIHIDPEKPKTRDEQASAIVGYEIANCRDIYSITPLQLSIKANGAFSRDRLIDIETGAGDPITVSELIAAVKALDVPADRLLGLE